MFGSFVFRTRVFRSWICSFLFRTRVFRSRIDEGFFVGQEFDSRLPPWRVWFRWRGCSL